MIGNESVIRRPSRSRLPSAIERDTHVALFEHRHCPDRAVSDLSTAAMQRQQLRLVISVIMPANFSCTS
jgi:hypothetical protein